jgi:hypothetical protein
MLASGRAARYRGCAEDGGREGGHRFWMRRRPSSHAPAAPLLLDAPATESNSSDLRDHRRHPRLGTKIFLLLSYQIRRLLREPAALLPPNAAGNRASSSSRFLAPTSAAARDASLRELRSGQKEREPPQTRSSPRPPAAASL